MALPTSPNAALPNMVASPLGSIGGTTEGGPVLSGSMNWEPVRQRLLGSDSKDALNAAMELREGIEINILALSKSNSRNNCEE